MWRDALERVRGREGEGGGVEAGWETVAVDEVDEEAATGKGEPEGGVRGLGWR